MEGDTKFKTSELLDCKHVENINFIQAKKERKKSHIQQDNHPTHRLGENRKTLTSTLSSMVITIQLWD